MGAQRHPTPARWALWLAIAAISLGVVALAAAALPRRGEVPPELYAQIVADLERRTGAGDSAGAGYYRITELRSEAVVWPDDALGCPSAPSSGEARPVQGYWVVLQVGASIYDYRARADRTYELCDRPS
ncbi:MAG: hypothetical protein ACRDFZ_02335 [Candidatus Limnocylindria bacterium]